MDRWLHSHMMGAGRCVRGATRGMTGEIEAGGAQQQKHEEFPPVRPRTWRRKLTEAMPG